MLLTILSFANIRAQTPYASLLTDAGIASGSRMETRAAEFKAAVHASGITHTSLYLYQKSVEQYSSLADAKKLAARIVLLGYTDVYLDIRPATFTDYAELKNKSWIQTFNAYLNYNGVRVYALMFSEAEQYNKTPVDGGQKGTNLIRQQASIIYQYNSSVSPNERFIGAAADWEPHTLKEGSSKAAEAGLSAGQFWDDNNYVAGGSNDLLLRQTIEMLAQAKIDLDVLNTVGPEGNSLLFTEAINPFFQQKFDEGVLKNGNTDLYFSDGNCTDVQAMVYSFKKEAIQERLDLVLNRVVNAKTVYAAIKTIVGDDEGNETSLKFQGWNYLIETINYIITKSSSKTGFKGICIYEYDGFEDMWERDAPSKYAESDKEGLRQIISQNLAAFGLTETDTLNYKGTGKSWYETEAWIDDKMASGNLNITWNTEVFNPIPLKEINISNKGLTKPVDFNYFSEIEKINCSKNQIPAIDLDEIGYIIYLDCSENKLQTLDLSQTKVEALYCQDNDLTAIRSHKNQIYSSIYCHNNYLTFTGLPITETTPNYYYSPQKDLDGGTLVPGRISNVSSEFIVNSKITNYNWTRNDGTNAVTDLGNGQYMFMPADIGKEYTCKMKNEQFPNLTLTYKVKIADPQTKHSVYNEGLLSVASNINTQFNEGLYAIANNLSSQTETDIPRLYIGGDFIAQSRHEEIVNGQTIARRTSKIYTNKSKVTLTGNFYNDIFRDDTSNKWGTVFASDNENTGVFEFKWFGYPQKITTHGSEYADIPSKKDNYIFFPNVRINNNEHVTIDPSIAVESQDIYLEKGWLILDSRGVDKRDFDAFVSVGQSKKGHSVFAHLLQNGNVYYRNWTATNPADRGFIQVNMELGNNQLSTTDPDYNNQNERSIVGFGSPFQQMRADYFMFNFLFAPDYSSFFGSGKTSIIDPKTTLDAGRGYVLGVDLRGTNQNDYRDIGNWGIPLANFAIRSTSSYKFNRHNYASGAQNGNQYFGIDVTTDPYTLEKLNGSSDVVVSLPKQGFQYLSNPFMTPLDLSDLLKDNGAGDWGIISDKSTNTNRDMLNRVWVLNESSVGVAKYAGNKVKIKHNYYVAKTDGGTFIDEDDPATTEMKIAPLQMFVISTIKDNVSIKIPRSKRVKGQTSFVKSIPINRRYDDFILEIEDEETGINDRLSVVLRPAAEISSDVNYRNVKKLTSEVSNDGSARSTIMEGLITPTLFSQIYTLDDQNVPLTVEFLPIETTTAVQLYTSPSSIAQNITIRGLRLNTKYNVNYIALEDKIERKWIELTPETVYHTYSSPTDRPDRFVLHFKPGEAGKSDIENDLSSIKAAYKSSTTYVYGFSESDYGSNIQIYSINGYLVAEGKVNNREVAIPRYMSNGVYIIKISGNCNKTLKMPAYN